LEFFKCDAGEGWRISWTGHVVRNEEVLQRVKEDRNILHTKNEGSVTGLDTSCVTAAL